MIAIECAVDIANHVISSENYRFPKNNADSFVVLVEEGVVNPALRERLRAMARFRNRLVHLYWEIDDPGCGSTCRRRWRTWRRSPERWPAAPGEPTSGVRLPSSRETACNHLPACGVHSDMNRCRRLSKVGAAVVRPPCSSR